MLDLPRLFRPVLASLLVTAAAACGAPQGQMARALADPGAGIGPEWAVPAAATRTAPATEGMVATTDSIATEVGTEILRRGGNAVDAAVATHFALAVVNPEAGNIGGGGFLVAHLDDGQTVALDFRETAPMAATREMFLDANGEPTNASLIGHLAAGVPGSVAGMWEAHRRFGSLPWASLLEPAIRLAEGMVVHERLAASLAEHAGRFATFPATAEIFLPGGSPPPRGEPFVQADLAETLRRIAREGKDGFYAGRTAALIEAEMQRGGGLITAADLARYEARWRDPIIFEYRQHRILSMPPPSSGGATLAEILNILEGYDLPALGYLSAQHVHLYAEAAKRAFADRNAYLADPDFVSQPVERMISDAYAGERRAAIDPDTSTAAEHVAPGLGRAPGEGGNTTHYSIVDGAGNAVAVTTTLNSLYGSRVTVQGAGFLLNNEMDDFTAKPGAPNQFGLVQGEANAVEPGKRMLSAMAPTIVLDEEGRVLLVTGSPGGPTIISTVAQMISNVVDWEMDLAEATSAPRLHHQHLPDILRYERRGLTREAVEALRARGHVVEERGGYQGDAQSVLVLPDGRLVGAGDPRRSDVVR